jgi:hypothetical protein
MYNLEPPPFVRVPYTVAPFQVRVPDGVFITSVNESRVQLPVDLISNGTAFANTAAVKTDTGCVDAPVSISLHETSCKPTNWAIISTGTNDPVRPWPMDKLSIVEWMLIHLAGVKLQWYHPLR